MWQDERVQKSSSTKRKTLTEQWKEHKDHDHSTFRHAGASHVQQQSLGWVSLWVSGRRGAGTRDTASGTLARLKKGRHTQAPVDWIRGEGWHKSAR